MINKKLYDNFTAILTEDLIPALGCTEPIAVALAAAKAAKILDDTAVSMELYCSGNIIKNVKGVTVPNSQGMKGADAAAILGFVGGDDGLDLQVLESVTEDDVKRAKRLLEDGFCTQHLTPVVSNLYIRVEVEGENHSAMVEIKNKHNLITRALRDGKSILENDECGGEELHGDKSLLNVHDIILYAQNIDINDVKPVISRQIEYNMAISEEGIKNPWGAQVGRTILKMYGDGIEFRARAKAAAGSDARMNGCPMPVVTNSGSGNQGITVSVPVIEYAKELGSDEDKLYRALVISNLISIHEKHYLGSLSAFCGAVSAACGAGAGIAYLMGYGEKEIGDIISNTLANVGGIVCDGAKSSCAAKISSALEAAELSAALQRGGCSFDPGDGLVKKNVEKTMETFGKLGREGMRQTDIEILNMMIEKD